MRQHEHFQDQETVPGVDGIALHALSVVASQAQRERSDMTRPMTPADTEIQSVLLDALIDPDLRRFDGVLGQSIENGLSVEDIANHHVPAIARKLGDDWLDDRLGFSSVSIACARLQSYLRQGGLDWCDAVVHRAPPTAKVLLFVPEYEQHTLGATLLAGQLRAQNVTVIADLDAKDDEMERAVSSREHDLVMISSSRTETLALLCTSIIRLRNNSACAPIMIGGHLLTETPDVVTTTGADFAAKSCDEAMDILASVAEKRLPNFSVK